MIKAVLYLRIKERAKLAGRNENNEDHLVSLVTILGLTACYMRSEATP